MTTLILDDFEPRRLVSANRRIHHMTRAVVSAYWRTLGAAAVHDAYGHADDGCTWHQRARVTVTFRFPDRRRRDVLNLYPYIVKPLLDGAVGDARLLPDDDDWHLVLDVRRDLTPGPHRIVLEVADLTLADLMETP